MDLHKNNGFVVFHSPLLINHFQILYDRSKDKIGTDNFKMQWVKQIYKNVIFDLTIKPRVAVYTFAAHATYLQ